MAEKDTKLVIKADLSSEKCRKKIKKILCNIPQIESQVYDTKANTVTITVVCGCLEKIKKKIRCRGGECIISIDPLPPPPTPPPPQDKKLEVHAYVHCTKGCGRCGGDRCDSGCRRPPGCGPCYCGCGRTPWCSVSIWEEDPTACTIM